MVRFFLGVLVAVAVAAAAGFAVMFTGAYDVAATSPHTALGRWVLGTTMENSVARRAVGIVAPARFSEEQARLGAARYRESCVYCHGAPGQDPADWATGILPEPPYLPDVVGEWSDAQLFWIVKNGIKMSAMPAFGPHVSDQEIWGIVGFVKQLPSMSPEQYQTFGEAPGQGNTPGQPGSGQGG
ncbi:MAG TPA: cytochrome c [Roseomonas sp.]|nr:cytochrome c [Roseomonas sp.]